MYIKYYVLMALTILSVCLPYQQAFAERFILNCSATVQVNPDETKPENTYFVIDPNNEDIYILGLDHILSRETLLWNDSAILSVMHAGNSIGSYSQLVSINRDTLEYGTVRMTGVEIQPSASGTCTKM